MSGLLLHTIRFTNALEWQPLGDVENAAGEIGQSTTVASAQLDGDLHVFSRGATILPLHAIRRTETVDWREFRDVTAGDPGGIVHAMAAANLDGDLHIVASAFADPGNRRSRILHTILFGADEKFQPFGDVTGRSLAGNPSADSSYGRIACAEVGGDLHVVVRGRETSGKSILFHTIRFTRELEWQPFGNVNSAASGSFMAFPRSVACARVGNDLHLVAPDDRGVLRHTIRFSDVPRWQAFGNASEAAGMPDTRIERASCAEVGGDLHVVALTDQGELLHTIRFSTDPRWQPFGDLSGVLRLTSRPGRRIEDIACAGVGGDLHVCFALSTRS